MRIQHNIAAMNSYRNYTNNTNALSKNLEKLSSGYKINRAGDDAAGLAISEKMRAQISGLKQASNNVKDGISLVKTAEGALQEVHDMLNRMTTLATQSANGTYDNDVDRDNLQKEVESLLSEIDRIADSSNFNGTKLLDGTLGGGDAKLTGIETSIGKVLGAAGTGIANAQDDTGVVVTKWSGINGANGDYTIASGAFAADGTFTAAGATGDTDIVVTVADADGNLTTHTAKLADILTVRDDEGAPVDDIADAGADGYTASLDLSFAGLGKIELAVTSDVANMDGAVAAALNGATAEVADSDNSGGLMLQIGDTADDYNQMTVSIGDMHTAGLGIDGVNISTQDGAAAAIETIKNAINKVSSTRGDLGAIQNRLEHTGNNLSVMTENIQDAESTIRDTDIADEMTNYTKNNILLQSAQAMLAQANQMPQGVLQLLQ